MFLSMFLFIFDSPVQIALVVGVIVLLFGAGRLPQLAKSLGQSRKAFKEGMREAEEDDSAHPVGISTNNPTPQITQMSDEELMAEMRRRVEAK
jgi:sec-independent protein translocase protein TatA